MHRLFRWLCVLFVIHLALIVTSRLSTWNTHSPFEALFTNADGTPCKRPCMFGVRPDRMVMEDAIKIVQAHWLIDDTQLTDMGTTGTIIVAKAKGDFTGKYFRIWLIPKYGDPPPTMVVMVSFSLMEPNDPLISYDLTIPITNSGTLMTLFGMPEQRTSNILRDNSHTVDFAARGIRSWIAPMHLVGKPTGADVFDPNPHDVVLGIQVSAPFPMNPRDFVAWCGFTRRVCDEIN